jgi:cobyrinic acid a,c-diamide synthase
MTQPSGPRGLMIAAARSGAGKTTVTLGLVAALRRLGVDVRTAKSGPDYIDPAFHAAASGAPGTNLDSWAMPPPLLDALAARAAGESGVLIVESAMGLFDGVTAPPGRSGSAADLAARFRLPVVLVLDISGQAQTAAAIARGFALHDPAVEVAGVILNRVASERHRRMAADAISAIGIPVFGAVPRDATLTMPERHLGLVQAAEHPELDRLLDRLAQLIRQNVDLAAMLAAAGPIDIGAGNGRDGILALPGQRIALAQDAAFSFTYPHILAGWRAMGAEILPFSPLADETPPDDADSVWLPGGYPELHAGRLAGAAKFRAGLSRFAGTRPVHGECGGYMALGAALIDADGVRHAMAGLLDHVTSFAKRKLNLGYRAATLTDPALFGTSELRGHEFHYATLADPGTDTPLARLRDSAGADLGFAGGRRGRVSGSFFHIIAPEAV